MTTREALILPEGVTAKEWNGEGARVVTLTQVTNYANEQWWETEREGIQECPDCGSTRTHVCPSTVGVIDIGEGVQE